MILTDFHFSVNLTKKKLFENFELKSYALKFENQLISFNLRFISKINLMLVCRMIAAIICDISEPLNRLNGRYFREKQIDTSRVQITEAIQRIFKSHLSNS